MTVNVPNLDGMAKSELMAFWSKYRSQSRKLAAELIGDKRRGYVTLANKLANYACNKAVAMDCRLKGNIAAAVIYESVCERIYDDLPTDLRW